MPGVSVTIGDECIGCGTCVDICFIHAIKIIDEKSVISNTCKGCGRCVASCPQDALTLTIDGIHNLDNSIEKIESLVDVT